MTKAIALAQCAERSKGVNRSMAGPPSSADTTWREGMRKVTVNWTRDDRGELRKFALKAPQQITHIRRLNDVGEPVARLICSSVRSQLAGIRADSSNPSKAVSSSEISMRVAMSR